MSLSFIAGLIILFIISFLGNGPIPLPLTATVLWLGQFGLPIPVILTATLGSLLGWLALERILRKWIQAKPEMVQRIPKAYRRVFMKNMGFWLFVFNALPLPLDFIRFLALFNGYNRARLVAILTISRLIRNTLLVTAGSLLAHNQGLLWGAMAGLLLLPLILNKLFQTEETAASQNSYRNQNLQPDI